MLYGASATSPQHLPAAVAHVQQGAASPALSTSFTNYSERSPDAHQNPHHPRTTFASAVVKNKSGQQLQSPTRDYPLIFISLKRWVLKPVLLFYVHSPNPLHDSLTSPRRVRPSTDGQVFPGIFSVYTQNDTLDIDADITAAVSTAVEILTRRVSTKKHRDRVAIQQLLIKACTRSRARMAKTAR